MVSIGLLYLVAFVFLIVGIALAAKTLNVRFTKNRSNAQFVPPLWTGILLVLMGILGIVDMTSAQYIGPAEIGVVENTSTGHLRVIKSGLHIWPFDSKVVPLVSNTSKYDLGAVKFEIGEGDKTNKDGVQADSNTEGRPVVYFHNQINVTPNPDKIIELHKKFGPGYINSWVKQGAESATKTVQGNLPFDYVGNNRGDFELKVREELERRLKLDVGESWVNVNQVVVINYDYDDSTNNSLTQIFAAKQKASQAEAELKEAAQRKLITETNAQADAAKVTTAAQAEKQKRDLESQGDLAKAKNDALGIKAIEEALASSPSYVGYLQATKWNGILPQFYGGNGVIPFFNVTPAAASATPTAK